jgi:putative IMPACT (imprinted ancient) family translation regulator
MLAMLEGSNLHEVVAVGTRYFGGIKLGTGGLVRAYGGCVREALAALPTLTMVLHHIARVEVDYSMYGPLTYHLPRLGVKVEEPVFTDRVALTLAAPPAALDEVAGLLQELTNGQITLTHWSGHRYDVAP